MKAEEEEGTFLPSGEWPENFSILNFEDLCAHYEPVIFKAEVLHVTLRSYCCATGGKGLAVAQLVDSRCPRAIVACSYYERIHRSKPACFS